MFSLYVIILVLGIKTVVKSSEDACETIAEWRQPAEAYTATDELVGIVQDVGPQVFYTVRCNETQEATPCNGIQQGFESHCETRFNLVMALTYVKSVDKRAVHLTDILRQSNLDRPTKWQMIKVPGQCVCTGLKLVRHAKQKLASQLFLQ
ncbi:unnamed protein product [Bursaphelenchus okinawaensis]|uniref:Nerve growth factor-related domain-containing protein n=1 Tax=Bursaphelenchus okinawaensis TaxID=465554 RepID=A0A811L3G0_9BILA|nr:unnamed protein product [Bursaphelenchus okinawaensis]CAG9115300.1 unnamed protein product [Bursaphelenchus okinawaensis]